MGSIDYYLKNSSIASNEEALLEDLKITSCDVDKITSQLGLVVLLECHQGTKKAVRQEWPDLRLTDMTPTYLRSLSGGNIGVLLGESSGGLCSIDIDCDEFVEPFLKANPRLRNTLRSKGIRGCNLWIRVTGYYPKTRHLKTVNGTSWGEWRSDRHQTIIAGKHPDGPMYRRNGQKPVSIAFIELVWPDNIKPKFLAQDQASLIEKGIATEREQTEHTQTQTATTPFLSVPICINSTGPITTIDQAVQRSLPTVVKNNTEKLFQLCRRLRGIEINQGQELPLSELERAFNQWYTGTANRGLLNTDETKDMYWNKFMDGLENVEKPATQLMGFDVAKALKIADEKPDPPEAKLIKCKTTLRLLKWCIEIQEQSGGGQFYLSARTAREHLGLKDHNEAARMFRVLRGKRIGVLKVIEQGKGIRASRYKYVGLSEDALERITEEAKQEMSTETTPNPANVNMAANAAIDSGDCAAHSVWSKKQESVTVDSADDPF